MEFKVNSKELEKILARVYPAIPSRTPMPILENFLFAIEDGALTVYATDLEISLKSSINIVAEENKSILLPAKLLYDVVRSFKDTTITFEISDSGRTTLTTEHGKYTISHLGTEDYPDIPSFPDENVDEEEINEFSINGMDLKYALEKTTFALSKEEMRPAMMGALFEFSGEGFRIVTTDGHRLVNYLRKDIKQDFDEQYIVPERALSVIQKLLDERDVKIFLTKTHISFTLNEIELISRLIKHKYPDYSSVIPLENEFTLKIKTKELHDAIKRMMLFSSSSTRRVKFSLKDNVLQISAEDTDLGASGTENILCEYIGDPLDIGFNSQYVNDILSHMTSEEELLFKLHSPTKAVIIFPTEKKENLDLMMLLMPVRLNS